MAVGGGASDRGGLSIHQGHASLPLFRFARGFPSSLAFGLLWVESPSPWWPQYPWISLLTLLSV